MNNSLLIELKKEYTILLKETLSPKILEGLQQIYNDSKKVSDKTTVLKTFQSLLKKIQSWENDTLSNELNRINMRTNQQAPWLVQLVQGIFKLHMLIGGYEASDLLKTQINYGTFIHQIYKECYRLFWRDPFLFYHEYSSLEQKKNYLIIMDNINNAIESSIRRLLPMATLLEKLLGEPTVNGETIGTVDLLKIPILLDLPIEKMIKKEEKVIEEANQRGGDNKPSSIEQSALEKNVNEKILNIINKNKVLTESNEVNNFTVNNHSNAVNSPNNHSSRHSSRKSSRHSSRHSSRKSSDNDNSSSTLKKIINESLRHSHNNATKTNSANSEMKNKVLKELDSETANYNKEANADNYQDVFSNSDVKNTINTNEKHEKKSRDKFFNNYLNI
jgi:hypothetical protein